MIASTGTALYKNIKYPKTRRRTNGASSGLFCFGVSFASPLDEAPSAVGTMPSPLLRAGG